MTASRPIAYSRSFPMNDVHIYDRNDVIIRDQNDAVTRGRQHSPAGDRDIEKAPKHRGPVRRRWGARLFAIGGLLLLAGGLLLGAGGEGVQDQESIAPAE